MKTKLFSAILLASSVFTSVCAINILSSIPMQVLSFSFFQTEASNTQEQSNITIRFRNQSLDSALHQLESQLEKMSEYQFVYQDSIVNKAIKINQNFENKTINQVLGALLANSDYSYAIINDSWVVIYKKVGDTSKTIQNGDEIPFLIQGNVVDENEKFVSRALVCIKEKDDVVTYLTEKNCTITDNDGSFSISTTNPNGYIIVLYIGYLPRVVQINNAGLIKLKPNDVLLNKVFRFN